MIIYTDGHCFAYELEKLTRLFSPFEKIRFAKAPAEDQRGLYAEAVLAQTKDGASLYAKAALEGRTACRSRVLSPGRTGDPDPEKEAERSLAALLFECYAELTGYQPEWGILTGIRPAKLYRRFSGLLGDGAATRFFKEEFRVTENKLSLLKETAAMEDAIIARSEPRSVSVYLSVPFCPSRCSYCSFVSHSIARAADLIPAYVGQLCREMEYTAEIINKLGLRVMTVYVGGGTPTTLTAEQLNKVLTLARKCFGDQLDEFTVEAGRPDTITPEKLEALRFCGVSRISINPQTMNDAVLQNIGRRHTALQTVEAFEMARRAGFDNINMDLIAGLPGDTPDSFADTLDRVIRLNPESVTVHTLSLKRSSGMGVAGELACFTDAAGAGVMVEHARERLTAAGILPYYMYRQSKTVGNLENVGYAKRGREGLYNVYIMDETHTILACGASAVTKLRSQGDGKIERIFNFKYPYEYLTRFDEMLRRKERVEEFYHEHPVGD